MNVIPRAWMAKIVTREHNFAVKHGETMIPGFNWVKQRWKSYFALIMAKPDFWSHFTGVNRVKYLFHQIESSWNELFTRWKRVKWLVSQIVFVVKWYLVKWLFFCHFTDFESRVGFFRQHRSKALELHWSCLSVYQSDKMKPFVFWELGSGK